MVYCNAVWREDWDAETLFVDEKVMGQAENKLIALAVLERRAAESDE